jgi:hypothetical protein
MSEMIERLAKRLYESQPDPDYEGRVWRSNGCETRPWLDMAQVALEELRKPTDLMLLAGAAQLDCDKERECWRAMIDEAMK